jgi:hypothetical protein
VIDALHNINADCDYPTYRDIIWALESLGWPDIEKLQVAWSMTAPHRYDEGVLYKIKGEYKPGPRSIRFPTLFHYAKQAAATARNTSS